MWLQQRVHKMALICIKGIPPSIPMTIIGNSTETLPVSWWWIFANINVDTVDEMNKHQKWHWCFTHCAAGELVLQINKERFQ